MDYRSGGKDGNISTLAYERLWQEEGSGGGVGDLKAEESRPKRKDLGRVAGGLIVLEGGGMDDYRWLYGSMYSYNDNIWR